MPGIDMVPELCIQEGMKWKIDLVAERLEQISDIAPGRPAT